jgi:hypothetical protein
MRKTTASAIAILITVLGTVARGQEGGLGDPHTEVQPPPPPEQPQPPPAAAGREQICDDRQDEDGDGLADCADSDCWEAQHCQAGQSDERDNLHCADWIDNDGDGAVDCEDDDCTNGPAVTVCHGSAEGARQSNGGATNTTSDAIPALEGDMSVEDLIGRGGDVDGERTDEVCSDGVDNDGDGRTDCADFGCRFDPSVEVCSSAPGIRFGVVVGIAGSLRIQETPDINGDGFTEFSDPLGDVRFQRLQLRAIGPIPFIQNSFFLLNIRAERTFRLTFAMFQIPLSNQGHFLSINSGSGGLSPGLIVSTSKQPLLDPPRYLFDGFEAPAGAAIEVGGPMIPASDLLRFRIFASGGSGEFNGNVGGRFFRAEDRNFSYGAGGQLQLNIVGHYNRLDTPFLYTEVPLTIATLVGGRFDQRPDERYVAWNAFAILRYWRFLIRAEHYGRYILDADGIHTAWNVQLSFLIWPRTLMFAADVGSSNYPLRPFLLDSMGAPTMTESPVMEAFQFRAAVHWFYFRQIGILSLLYSMSMNCQEVFGSQCLPPDAQPDAALSEHEIRLEAQFRF